jgi:hypothetical protein
LGDDALSPAGTGDEATNKARSLDNCSDVSGGAEATVRSMNASIFAAASALRALWISGDWLLVPSRFCLFTSTARRDRALVTDIVPPAWQQSGCREAKMSAESDDRP